MKTFRKKKVAPTPKTIYGDAPHTGMEAAPKKGRNSKTAMGVSPNKPLGECAKGLRTVKYHSFAIKYDSETIIFDSQRHKRGDSANDVFA